MNNDQRNRQNNYNREYDARNAYRGGEYSPRQESYSSQSRQQYTKRTNARRADNSANTPRSMMIVAALCVLVLIFAVFYIGCNTCAGSCAQDDLPQDDVLQSQQQQPSGPATVRVTFPEGYNVVQIGERLEENGVCSASDLYNTMNTVDFSAEYTFLPSAEVLSVRPYRLEGYMFPDTYDFYVGESPESVIRRFLNNFQSRVSAELMSSAAQTGDFYNVELSFDDIMIMASIVEKEISVPSEMDGVAAVFYNRMKYPGGTVNGSATGGYFQSDATKFYPYTVYTAPDGFVSEYNTFNVKGLPQGPICCPSYDAIVASLDPDHENGAFFFYTDINKKVYYAVTLSEHQKNWKYCVDNGLNPW